MEQQYAVKSRTCKELVFDLDHATMVGVSFVAKSGPTTTENGKIVSSHQIGRVFISWHTVIMDERGSEIAQLAYNLHHWQRETDSLFGIVADLLTIPAHI